MNASNAPFWSAVPPVARNRGAAACLSVALVLGWPLSGPAAELRLTAFQTVRAQESAQAFARGATAGIRLRLQGTAQHYDLLLEPNTALVAGGLLGDTEALRGSLPGQPGSWARLTRRDGTYRGIYSNGVDTFIVEPAASLAATSPKLAALTADTLVVYRLADLQIRGALLEGDTRTTVRTAADTMGIIGAEMAAATAVLPTKRLDVGVLADTELVALDGTSTDSKALDRINVIDGIFSSQVGVQIHLAGVTHVNTTGDGLASTDPSKLLDAVSTYRQGSASQQAAGLTHLLTGRDLDGTTIGIAFLGSLCSRMFSASLSQARSSVALDGLVAAHEMGHVFGAPHDGEAGGACASTPDNQYLMAPRLNGSSTFSDCSLQQIAPTVAAASCLAQISAPDAAISVPTSTSLALNQATTATFTVSSVGTATVAGVAVTVTPPAGITINGGSVAGGSCAPSGTALRCTLGDLAAGAQRDVQLSLTGTIAGKSSAILQLTATNDSLSTNNRSALALVTAPGADLAATLSGDGTQVTVGQPVNLRATLQNLGLAAAPDATVSFRLPTGVTVTAATGSGATCTFTNTTVDCPTFSLAANAQATVDLSLRADQTGSLAVSVTLRSPTLTDPQPGNNTATATLTGVAAPPPVVTPPASTGGSGGGGGSGAGLVGLAALLAAWQRARRYWPVFEK